VSGFLGQRLLALLDAAPEVARVVGLDVREPPRRARKLAFHRVDVVNADLAPFLRGVDTVVHLAAIVEPVPDDALVTRVNRDGTRRVLEHAGASGVRKFVRPSSAAVYGAWANNPVPLREDAPLRPNPGFLPAICDAESERLVAAWRAAQEGRVATRLRIAPVLGEGAPSLFASYFSGRTPLAVRHAAPPVQVVHLDDAASALAHAVVHDLDGVYNVAADGWIAHDDWLALLPRRRVPGIPHEVALRLLQALWASGLADVPPAALPYLTQPWVVANDRLTDTGWAPRHTNEEAVVLASVPANAGALPWVAAVGAVVAGAAGATWWLRHRRR
jgi:nucleoside-diphosphate-sugar epimerase